MKIEKILSILMCLTLFIGIVTTTGLSASAYSKNYNKADEQYVKNIKLKHRGYVEVDLNVLKNTKNHWDMFFERINKYYTNQINDSSITVKSSSRAGDGNEVNLYSCEAGVIISIYKNRVLYDKRKVGDIISLPVVKIPEKLPEKDIGNYVITALKDSLKISVSKIQKCDKINIIGTGIKNLYVKDLYKVNMGVEDGYVIVRRNSSKSCKHTTTKVVGKKSATYFSNGYTGDKKCNGCNKIISKGKTIVKLKLKAPSFSVSAGKKLFRVKYTRTTGATGFQVKYTVGKKTVTKTFNTTKSVTKTVSGIKKGSYKVQIRSFVKQGSKTAYSSWTKAKSIKVK